MFNSGVCQSVFSPPQAIYITIFQTMLIIHSFPGITSQKHINKPSHDQSWPMCSDRSRPTKCKASQYAPPQVCMAPACGSSISSFPSCRPSSGFWGKKNKAVNWVDQISSRENFKILSYKSLQTNICWIEMKAT